MSQNQKDNMNNMKKNLTLDFNQVKKNLTLPLLNNPVLDSPDIHKLNLPTPEMENMIVGLGSVNTPTPSLIYSRPVTEEQESFATGFVNALNNLHNSNSQEPNVIYQQQQQQQNVEDLVAPLYTPMVLKEETDTISSSPPLSPVNMQYQERMKLERKRQRNRLAATKCRTRKLERISKLEDRVKLLKTENADLGVRVHQLTSHVSSLKVEIMQHLNAGCQIIH